MGLLIKKLSSEFGLNVFYHFVLFLFWLTRIASNIVSHVVSYSVLLMGL